MISQPHTLCKTPLRCEPLASNMNILPMFRGAHILRFHCTQFESICQIVYNVYCRYNIETDKLPTKFNLSIIN